MTNRRRDDSFREQFFRCWFAACLSLLAITTLVTSAAADIFPPEQRFAGMLSDGARVFADKPAEWGDESNQPKLAGLAVFDAGRPFRWVIDQSVSPSAEPASYVEFFGGDRLPGQVTDFVPSQTDSFENVGEYLTVEQTISIDLPNTSPSTFVRISTDWLRRIVWEKVPGRPHDYRPGTAVLRDGSQHPFKAARWAKGAVALLTDEGIKSLFLSQLAELHFPQRGPWDCYFEQLGALSPDLTARLMQIETGEGLRLTSSTLRYKAQHHGDRGKPEDWYPLFQPAWSLDPLIIPFRVIREWRFFVPQEPPLTLFDPAVTRNKPVFSGGWHPRTNRNVQGESLRAGKLLFGWGFGVHAPTELDLALHPVVSGFRVQSGLDQIIRRGGCVKSVVAMSNNVAAPLHQSDVLIGPDAVADTNWLSVVPPADAAATLKLIADPVIAARPAGADPFDVRDCLDWLEPQWRLNPDKLREEVASRLVKRLPALREWSITNRIDAVSAPQPSGPGPIIKLSTFWDNLIPEDAYYRIDFEPVDKFVVLSRKLTIGKDDRWLALTVTRRPNGTTPARLQVRANGVAIGEGVVPERPNRAQPDPVLLSVKELQGKTVDLTVILMADGAQSSVDWRGARLLAHHPGLVRLFDEGDDEFLNALNEGEGTASLSTDEKQLGKASLKVTEGDRGGSRLPGFEFNIAETPKLGEYRYIRFAWKKVGGTEIGLQIAHNGQLGVLTDGRKPAQPFSQKGLASRRSTPPDNRGAALGYQYDISTDPKPQQPVLRLEKKISGQWEAHTRDIFGEFGRFQITGLGFRCPNGDAAYFDGIYLARSQQDFNWMSEWTDVVRPETPNTDPNVLVSANQQWEYSSVLSKVAPRFTTDASLDAVRQMKAIAGREAVRTHPPAQGKPCVLRSPLSVPAGKKTVLKLSCARRSDGDWQLAVVAEGQDLLRVMIDANTAASGWASHEVDLSRFAGKNIVLEVHNNPNSWPNEDAYWGSVKVETQ